MAKTGEDVIGAYESLNDECEEMLSLTRRLQSFRSWPFAEQLSPENMAKAGWYQTGPLCCRHVILMKELDGWDGTEDPVDEIVSRKTAFTTCKWSPGVKSLQIPDNEILVGTRYRLLKLQKICSHEKTIDDVAEWQEERKAQLMKDLHKKYPVEEDAEHQIAIFESTIGRKMRDQLEGMQNNLEAMKKHFSVKFRTKKNAPKIKFQGKAEDHDIQLATVADKKWIDVIGNADENEPPADSLPKPVSGSKSRQSMLVSANPHAQPPSARKTQKEKSQFSRNTSGYPSIPEFASIPE